MKIIVGNWKMNGNASDKTEMMANLGKIKTNNTIILCLPFTLLNGENAGFTLGAQDVSQHENGAFTGDISAQMLQEIGVKYVIVGHSERRINHQETNEIVRKKAEIAIKHDIKPIICVGENLAEYESGKTIEVISKMLSESIPLNGNFIIAYEPVWAIGTQKTPSLKEIQTTIKTISEILLSKGYENTPILYGGSVNPTNIEQILSINNVDGVLVGGASLKSETFLPIINSTK